MTAPAGTWQDRAACRGGPDVFHPPDGEHGTRRPGREQRAKAFCARCPVTAECLAHAYAADDRWAVLGGTTPDERRQARRIDLRAQSEPAA